MNKTILALALTGSALALSGCVTDGYGYGGDYAGVTWGAPYAYDGWYDGYYGDIYDGYWGGDGYFYYRHGPDDHGFHRADRNHFAHDAPHGGGHGFRQMQGQFHPQQGMNMPRFQGGGGGHGGGGRGHGHR